MKHILKTKFDEYMWAETYDLRRQDVAENLKLSSLKSIWPFLFSKQGVIGFSKYYLTC